MATKSLASCIFCKIIKGEIPSFKLIETDLSYSFLDIGPIARGHTVIIPKYHGEKLHDIPDEHLIDQMKIAKKLAVAQGLENYNILQNNGKAAHQVVPHVHFHLIPKPVNEAGEGNDSEGLVIGWPAKQPSKDELAALHAEITSKL
ncbi:HIT-like protein [Punctularia strigosozonata HHB-11173 SS5]|uniref:HIT-like protein n=1 Tax=Punctularia strigosozonata (strain HHB-11173) TaxID=741275 RepID=UPI00044175B5|nr:HIT-like protein [Punctularia strigosozonata HHB-11173 SS5]EIN12164.1 HIT-like protein [Punctularia strigosozonata HHB-11173 SS5]